MSISSRFAVGAHILTLLAKGDGKPVTSDWIAGSANTNPAVVRRLLTMLAKAGLTTSQLGTGGGALLAKAAEDISLLDVYRAVDEGELFALHNAPPSERCPVGRTIQSALLCTMGRAEAALEAELAKTTIAELATTCSPCGEKQETA
jgi:Rrf2 family protein